MKAFLALLVLCVSLGAQCPADTSPFLKYTFPTQTTLFCGWNSLSDPAGSIYIDPSVVPHPSYTQTVDFLSYPFPVLTQTLSSTDDLLACRFHWDSFAMGPMGLGFLNPAFLPVTHASIVTIALWLPGASTNPLVTPFGTWENPDPSGSFFAQFHPTGSRWLSNGRIFTEGFQAPSGNFTGLNGVTVNVQVMIQTWDFTDLNHPPYLLIGAPTQVTIF